MEKLSFKEKVGYASGDFAGNVVWQMIMFFLPIFYTDTFGISAAAAGTLFLVARLFDTVTDPVMGIICDRTDTRWGKFRPYLFLLSIPYGIAAFLMFTTPSFSGMGKLIYAYATYILMMAVFTAITVPYNALSGVMTNNAGDRVSLNSFRFFGAFAAGLIIQGLSYKLIHIFGKGNEIKGYQITMGLFGIMAAILFVISFISTKERVQPQKSLNSSLRHDLKDLTRNKPWIVLFFFTFIFLVFVAIRSGIVVYYLEYYMGRKDLTGIFLALGTGITMCTTLFSKWLSKELGKKKALQLSTISMAIFMSLFYLVKPGNIILLFIVQSLFAIVSGPPMPILWSMYADSADYSEKVNNRRATGLVFSAATFGLKFGVAIGSAVLLWTLAFYGYSKDVMQIGSNVKQGIRLLISFYPAILAVISVIIMGFYKLNLEVDE